MLNISLGRPGNDQIRFLFPDSPDRVRSAVFGRFPAEFLSTLPYLSEDGSITLLAGLGQRDALTPFRFRELAAKAVRQLQALSCKGFSADLSEAAGLLEEQALREMVLGAVLGDWKFSGYQSQKKESAPTELILCGFPETPETERILRETVTLAECITFARDLVSTPANLMTPEIFAGRVADAFRGNKNCHVDILGPEEISTLGMGAMYAVGRGSKAPPRLAVLRYTGGEPSDPVTAFVGKGITMDTGGYCLKTASSMKIEKCDMAGAAAAACAVIAAAKNRLPVNAAAVLPCCENRLSSNSYLPGDLLTTMSGKTVEIVNTDAEGRLVLSDAITYAIRKENAARIVDIATLTGSAANTFGSVTAAALSNDRELWEEVESAAKQAGEPLWRLPDNMEYRRMLDSDLADLKNVGDKQCGAITGGLFLRAFVENLPWVHLDIAGTAWLNEPRGETTRKGASGAGTETLYYLLLNSAANHEAPL